MTLSIASLMIMVNYFYYEKKKGLENRFTDH